MGVGWKEVIRDVIEDHAKRLDDERSSRKLMNTVIQETRARLEGAFAEIAQNDATTKKTIEENDVRVKKVVEDLGASLDTSLRQDIKTEVAKVKQEMDRIFQSTKDGKMTEQQMAAKVLVLEAKFGELESNVTTNTSKLMGTLDSLGASSAAATSMAQTTAGQLSQLQHQYAENEKHQQLQWQQLWTQQQQQQGQQQQRQQQQEAAPAPAPAPSGGIITLACRGP